MHKKSRITLDIPDPDYFDDDEPHVYIPVPSGVVGSGIELLECMLAQWKQEEGAERDDEVWHQLVVSVAAMLSGLWDAWTGYYYGDRGRLLVEQVARYCWPLFTDRSPELEAVRTADNSDIVDALLALHRPRLGKDKEANKQQATAEQAIGDGKGTTERDPGWEF
jgi:hypothetical protein